MALQNELGKFCVRTDRPSVQRRALTPAEALARLAAKAPKAPMTSAEARARLALPSARARLAEKAPLTPAEALARLDARAQITARRIQLHEQRMRWA